MSEADWIARLRERLSRSDVEHVRLGVGDDAAIVRFDGDVVCSVDEQRQGVHFEREWLSLEQLGERACACSLSDLAAMGSAPRAMLLSIAWPESEPWQEGMRILEGAAQVAERYDAPIVGGNLSRGREVTVSVTALGVAPPRPILRSGARPGDRLFVSGTVGGAALGWRLLARDPRDTSACALRWKEPRPRFDLAAVMGELANAAIDVSDGLLSDASQLARESGVSIHIERELLPLMPSALEAARSIGEDATSLALRGGEDYELLFTAACDAVEGATRIGRIEVGAPAVRLDGEDIARSGHDHFA